MPRWMQAIVWVVAFAFLGWLFSSCGSVPATQASSKTDSLKAGLYQKDQREVKRALQDAGDVRLR